MPGTESIVAAVLDALDGNRQRTPFTTDLPGFSTQDVFRAPALHCGD